MQHQLAHLLSTYGYWGLCGGLAIEYLFIPIPGETTLTTVGILWQQGTYHLVLFWLITATTMGTFAGSMFGYMVGRLFGRPFLLKFGRFIRLTPERIDKADRLFAKYTVPTLVFSRYIAGIRILVPYIAGINRVRLWVYIPVILVSSALWTSTFILAGSVIERAWHNLISNWQRNLIPVILVAIVLVVGYIYLHRWMKRKIDDTTEPSVTESHPDGNQVDTTLDGDAAHSQKSDVPPADLNPPK